jgi:hypothetical protein
MRQVGDVQARPGLEMVADDPLLDLLVGFIGEG